MFFGLKNSKFYVVKLKALEFIAKNKLIPDAETVYSDAKKLNDPLVLYSDENGFEILEGSEKNKKYVSTLSNLRFEIVKNNQFRALHDVEKFLKDKIKEKVFKNCLYLESIDLGNGYIPKCKEESLRYCHIRDGYVILPCPKNCIQYKNKKFYKLLYKLEEIKYGIIRPFSYWWYKDKWFPRLLVFAIALAFIVLITHKPVVQVWSELLKLWPYGKFGA